MITKTGRGLIRLFENMSQQYPSFRLGQLVVFACSLAGEDCPGEADEVNDEVLAEACRKHLRKRSRRLRVQRTSSLDGLSAKRADLLGELRHLVRREPDASFGRLVSRLAAAEGATLYDIEDEALLKAARWRCLLCGRSQADIGNHSLPICQKAHILPNRLSGHSPRYGGAKNRFTEAEWSRLLDAFGAQLDIAPETDKEQAKRVAGDRAVYLCGECHEEVLSEPIYLPEVLAKLAPIFHGKSRIDKILLLSRALQLGVEALEKQRRDETENYKRAAELFDPAQTERIATMQHGQGQPLGNVLRRLEAKEPHEI
jgi:hypothetical protein